MHGEHTHIVDAEAISAIVAKVGLGQLYDLTIERMAAVLTGGSGATVEMKQRDGFLLTTPQLGLLEWMPAVRHGATVSIKMVGYNPHNPVKNQLPTILSTLCAFDADSGHLRAVVDGTFATAIRTGAASALASRVLARPDSAVLGLVGCGAQAVTQLHALSRVFPFAEVLVCDTDVRAENSFAARARLPEGVVRVAALHEVEELADVLCTATSVAPHEGPVIRGTALKPWVHVNTIGSDMPGKTELPLDLLRKAVVVPDHLEQARAEGDCQQLAPEEIGPPLSEILQDTDAHRRLSPVTTVYDSTGLAVQDLVMVEVFEELARELGVGHRIAIEATADDPQDPYSFLPGAVTHSWAARLGSRS
ncbi:ornithine cyclodeaminase family protein [Streptomyces sp. H27-C3]|uniref:ornithine cyclodeaminase family protein n=1 Tax=Streptomyces sp. H27-C3 TaxID=3046305 RepID=UPI0024BA443F|nr:ornithine cyclodeaminase family protein [Streptomyces sp. H27-C3]MDJ0463808.1 ornithine cyclodeaminase family protein [Streptomyces sp. H27-C3]